MTAQQHIEHIIPCLTDNEEPSFVRIRSGFLEAFWKTEILK